ncbi:MULTISPECIES: hypothetical protein [unclassified Streptomyces]|uniref:hypothetical protein n=1 Tax=unclassified Streptomyces TaxID=2593676 RepID=UPI0006AE4D1C|nr:hypothetical protein [Streptomyces sp. WM6378]KOU41885.1 hypothetical protein ADK54_20455 [Streptomyces sp. WM6378]
MNASLSDVQRTAIAAIVRAVDEGRGHCVIRLLDEFVREADLTALFALREALHDARTSREDRSWSFSSW